MKRTLFLIASLLTSPVLAQEGIIWIEGEAAEKSSARKHGWYNSVKPDELSAGEWLSHFSNAGPAEGRWTIDVADGGEHEFWVRANPVGAKLSWRMGGQGEWTAIDFSDTLDQANIAADGGMRAHIDATSNGLA